MADGQIHIEGADKPKPTGLDLLREPFPPHQISKLPKESGAQAKERKDRVPGCMVWGCKVCGGNHHKDAVHLDYVGHAALTDRLLDCDPNWNWEPYDHPSLPTVQGGMWIKLTVCGVSRIGFGSADGKTGGDAIKEIIGDALRNAAMRFGAALDLWHKGQLHLPESDPEQPEAPPAEQPEQQQNAQQTGTKSNSRQLYTRLQKGIREARSRAELERFGKEFAPDFKKLPDDWYREIKAEYAKELEAHIAAEKQPENERG